MSHFSTLRTKVTDAEILKQSLSDLGIATKTEADVRGYNGQRVRADIVAVLDGEYDLGWSRNADGSFDLIADLWGVAKKHNQTELIKLHQPEVRCQQDPGRSEASWSAERQRQAGGSVSP